MKKMLFLVLIIFIFCSRLSASPSQDNADPVSVTLEEIAEEPTNDQGFAAEPAQSEESGVQQGYPAGLVEENEYLIYAPEGLSTAKTYPLLVTFSPGANGQGLIKEWQELADKHHCILFASKIVRNGMNPPPYLERLVKIINEKIAAVYPIKTNCIIAAGTSGGGMTAHLFSFLQPDTVAGVITSVGYIHENSLKQSEQYPRNKACVFLTSPTDFNYKLMKEDVKFLKKHDWNTLWLEFEGGHRTGPLELRDEALGWILQQSEITDK